MRKVKLSVACSLDGYISRVDGSLSWISMTGDNGLEAFINTVDTALIGRKTFASARDQGQSFFGDMDNFVFSKTLSPGRQNEVEIVDADPLAFVNKLKKKPGKDIWLFGGQELSAHFLSHNAVDEILLAVQPILLGDGTPLFSQMRNEIPLRLVESKASRNGVVSLTYRKKGARK